MRQMKTCINKIIYTGLLLSLAAIAAANLWSAQPKPGKATLGSIIVEIKKAEIKSQPTAGAGIIAIAFKGEIFKVLHELPEWYLIELSPGKEGYLAKKYARAKILDRSKKERTLVSKPAKKELAENYVLIISSGSYIRTVPSVDGKIVAQAKSNTAFKLRKKVSSAWYEIALPNSQKCYIPATISIIITLAELTQLKAQRNAETVSKAASQPQPAPQLLYAVTMKNDIILRQEPNITAKIIVTTKPGDYYKFLSQEGDWCTVSLPDGRQAYILAKVVRIVNEPELPAAISEATKAAKRIKLRTVSVTDKSAKLRSKASNTAKVISAAKQGTVFKLVWIYKGWYEVATSLGTAFISDKSAKLINDEELEVNPVEHNEGAWLKDKYVLVTTNMVNLRESANIKSRILARANIGNTYKLLARHNEWYEIFLPPKQNAFIAASLTEIITEVAVLSGSNNWQETKQLREATELAKRQEAEPRAQEQEWLKDKYVLVKVKKAILQNKPNIRAKIIATVNIGDSYKLVSRSKEWYEINFSSGAAFLNANLGKILTETELAAQRQQETEAKALKLREATELAKRQEAAEKAKLENERKTKENTERRAKEAAELKARLLRAAGELKERQEAEAIAKNEAWCKDKYILIMATNVNLRAEPTLKSKVLASAKKRDFFKLLSRSKDWYEIFLPPDQNAFVSIGLVNILTEDEVESRIRKEREPLLRKQREAEALARRKEAERLAAAEKAKKAAAEKVLKLRAAEELKVRQKAELKAKLETELKAREEKERLTREAAELKAREFREVTELAKRQEAEAKTQEEEWLKDKYVIITKKDVNLHKACGKTAPVIAQTSTGDSYKLVSRSKEWYEINFSSGAAFLNANLGKIFSETELAAQRQKEAEAKTLQEAAEQARLENERKTREDAERRAREDAEIKAKKEAEAKAQEQEWLKDKYVIIIGKNINLRQAPNKTAPITAKAKTGESYKLISRLKEWYEVSFSSGVAFLAAGLADIVSEKELEVMHAIEREATELKERQESEIKSKNEVWCKDKYVVVMTINANMRSAPAKNASILGKANKGGIFKILDRGAEWYEIFLPPDQNAFVSISLVDILTEGEVESRIKKEREPILKEAADKAQKIRQEAERKERKEAEEKARLENEKKTKEATELKAKEEAETKVREIEWIKDKYILAVKQTSFHPAPNKKVAVSGTAAADTSYKIVTRTKEWYGIDTSSGTAFVPIEKVKLLTEPELTAYRQQQDQARQEKLKKEAIESLPSATTAPVTTIAEKPAPEQPEKEKEQKVKAATEEKVKQKAEADAKMLAYIEDKYILTVIDNTNIRTAPDKNAPLIIKAKRDESFKVTWIKKDRLNTSWYQVSLTSGTQVMGGYAISTLTKLVTKQQLGEHRFAQAQAIEKKNRLETERKDRIEAERLAKIAAEQKAKADTERKAKEEAELKTKLLAEEIAKKEAAEKVREEAERKLRLEKAEAAQKASAEKARLEAEAKVKESEWLKDKYVLITLKSTNVRKAPYKNAELITKVNQDATFKLIARGKEWYELSLVAGQSAFVMANLVQVISEAEVQARAEAERKAQEEKLRLEATAKAAREEELKTKEEAVKKAKEAAELKAQMLAEAKAKKEAADKARIEAELKVKEEATQKAKLAAEQKAKDEAEACAREQEWLKDKYVLIINPDTNIRKAPSKNADIIAKAMPDLEYKLFSRSKNNEWYEIVSLTGTGFVNAAVVKLLTEQELTVLRQQQKQARLEKLKKETEAKARREAELQAKLETTRKATEEQAKQIEEARVKETAWLEDKYILVPDKNSSLRTAPDSTASLLGKTSNANESFKLLSRSDRNWYQIQTSAGIAFITVAAARVMSEQELNIFRMTEQKTKQEAELQAKLSAEEKARKEAETKAAREAELKASIEKEQIIREEKLKREAADKAQREIERQAKLEAERKAKEEAELKAQQTAEIKTRLENESKAKMEAYVVDKYILVTGATADLKTAPSLKARNISRAKTGASFKVSWIENEKWFRIITDNGQTAYVTAATVKLMTEKELSTLRETEAKAKLEVELQAKEAASLKEKLAAEEKARKETALIAKLESDRQAREEKLLQEAEAQARQQAERQARLEAEQKAKAEAERKAQEEAIEKAKLEAEEKAIKKAALKATQEAEQKARAEAERKVRESAEAKARIEAEAKVKMEAYVKDKYIVIADNNAAVRTAPNILASILYVAEENESFKLQWIRDNWYEIKVPSGTGLATGFVDTIAAKSMTMKELTAWQKVQEQERLTREAEELKARQQAELKAKEEAALKAKLAAEQKAREEAALQAKLAAEQKAREEAERKGKEEAEALAKEQEWLKNKYVLITTKDTNIRMKASKNADIINKALLDKDYKLISRNKNNEWYQIDISSGAAFVNAAVVKVMTDQELAAYRQQQEQARQEKAKKLREAAELKERQTTEEKARKEAELKARQEAAQKIAEEKARLELEAEQKVKQAEEKLSLEEQARMEVTAKTRAEAEQKSKAEEDREDQAEYAYIIINASYAEIKSAPDLGAPALLIALKGDTFKYNGQQKGWYNILTFSGETRFVRKSLCRGSNIAPQLVKDESRRRDIYDTLIDAKDRAMSEANSKYPSIKSQSELQEKIYYQQTVEEKFILEVFHKYRIQPATYLTLLSEAISKNW